MSGDRSDRTLPNLRYVHVDIDAHKSLCPLIELLLVLFMNDKLARTYRMLLPYSTYRHPFHSCPFCWARGYVAYVFYFLKDTYVR